MKYLNWMSEKGFVEVDEAGFVSMTHKGEEAYDRFANISWRILAD